MDHGGWAWRRYYRSIAFGLLMNSELLLAAMETLAENVRANTDMMKTLRESIDDVRTEIEHLMRNREFYLQNGQSERLPESVSCAHCDAGADSLQEAVREGWLDLCQDEDGLSYNFLGVCPSCAKKEIEADMERQRRAKAAEADVVEQKDLFQ